MLELLKVFERQFKLLRRLDRPRHHWQPRTQQGNPVKKKKCHHQRKKQRYRRQLYTRGLDTLTIGKLVKEKLSSQAPQDDTASIQEPDMQNIKVYIPLDRVGYC